ncbi:unnamed protein product [Miscanthus lutarioriparius]|uniref:DUF1618 domain-containing protein n=1 Tax=Miscanthus lutarioriparius TaxID=422564 RepID=A0A811QPH9_9POAL|nr:unnamed protein product [Miscanthus lutarioriparius]
MASAKKSRRRRCGARRQPVPVLGRVDYGTTGFIVCDMAEEEIPKLRYVPLPATQHDGYCGHYPDETRAYCTLGAAGPDAVRFVGVSPPRCCLGDFPGKTSCEGSSSSFNVTTWTMTLSTEEATTWVKDVVLYCDEIWKWRLPNYGCLPRDKHPEYPMVSSDDPDVIYFKVEDDPDVICFKVEVMAVEINTRTKKLLSVVPSGTRDLLEDEESSRLITAKLRW